MHRSTLSTQSKDPTTANASKLVQMRFKATTLARVEHLQEMTGIDNRTQIVASAIEVAEWLARTSREGGKIYVERPDGSREAVVVVGL